MLIKETSKFNLIWAAQL